MHHRQVPNFCHFPTEKQRTETTDLNPNKTLSWSSIKSNHQDQISAYNYKVSNPSSSLIMSSLSHIQEDDVETTGSTVMYQNSKQQNKPKTTKSKGPQNTTHQDFYQYLMDQNESDKSVQMTLENVKKIQETHNNFPDQCIYQTPEISQSKTNQNHPICFQHEYMIPPNNNKNFTLMNYHSGCSAQQSLIHLQQSQQQLSFLKFKLQQAYEKLQKQIMNSYQLEEKIECLKAQIQGKDQLIELENTQNQKLKFTLKAIMKNKSFLEQEIQKGQTKKNTSNQTDRQNQLKENLKLKLQLKELTTKIKSYEDSLKSYQQKNQSLESQHLTVIAQLTETKKQCESLREQIAKKDQYLQTLQQQFLSMDSVKAQNKKLLVKETQYLNQINVIEVELRKVTDQKVTSIARLKHELAMVQKQNEELLRENEVLNHGQRFNVIDSQMISYSPVGIPQTQFVTYSPSPASKKHIARSVNKYSNHNLRQMNQISLQPMIFDCQDETQKSSQQSERWNHYNDNSSIQSHTQNDSLNVSNSLNGNQRRAAKFDENKENMQSENTEQSFVERLKEDTSKTQGTVGKWKKSRSQSNNSSLHIQASSKQQNHHHMQYPEQVATKTPQNSDPIQNIINEKLSSTLCSETEDQKLSKYQQHRKKIESELSNLEKIKRPTAEERQKMQKLQKQLYYIDSDIAGLKRKIRRKY